MDTQSFKNFVLFLFVSMLLLLFFCLVISIGEKAKVIFNSFYGILLQLVHTKGV